MTKCYEENHIRTANAIEEILNLRGYEVSVEAITKPLSDSDAIGYSFKEANSRIGLVMYPKENASVNGMVEEYLEQLSKEKFKMEQMAELAELIGEANETVLNNLFFQAYSKESSQRLIDAGLKVFKIASEPFIYVAAVNLTAILNNDDSEANATVKVTESIAEKWGLEDDKIIDHCIRNMLKESIVQSMEEALGIEDEIKIENPGMVVLSNKSKRFGAAQILLYTSRLDIASKLGTDNYYIVPSSIHEVLAIDSSLLSPEQALEMVKSVNEAEVSPEDKLEDALHVFENNNYVFSVR